ncbi:MAG: DUF1648 domain-containing protein [Clostridia bacterium]|nr:DUF1648 domain-containing protein [Clostridia bacterium]
MKTIRFRILLITVLICLLPILLGVVWWERLPETMAIHFNFNGEPDHFAPKGFVVYGLPCLMGLFQAVACVAVDLQSKTRGEQKKVEWVSKWILPVITVVLYFVTLGYGLSWKIDIRMTASLLVGGILLVTGNYLPKLDYVKHYQIDTAKARKINRFLGYETAIMGVLFLISIFLPPIAAIVCLLLLIPYTVIGVIYGICVVKSGEN